MIGHGYVIVRYDPDIEPAQLARLKRLATKDSRYAFVSPDPELGQPLRVITAQRQLDCTKPEVDIVVDFHDAWLQSIGI